MLVMMLTGDDDDDDVGDDEEENEQEAQETGNLLSVCHPAGDHQITTAHTSRQCETRVTGNRKH